MATTISGTTVTFNDGTTQTTNVPTSTAALSAGGLGTYAMLHFPSNTTQRTAGYTVAGTSLKYGSAIDAAASATSPPGSWRLCGELNSYSVGKGTGYSRSSVWLRYA